MTQFVDGPLNTVTVVVLSILILHYNMYYFALKQHVVADRYNLNKLVDHETRKEYQIDVSNRFSA